MAAAGNDMKRFDMKKGKSIFGLIGAVLFLGAALSIGAAELPPDIRDLQGKYQAHLRNLESTHTNRLATLAGDYRKALRETRARLQAAGSATAAEAVAAEEARFGRGQGIPDADGAVSDVTELADLQQAFVAKRQQISREKNETIVTSAKKYEALLADKLKKAGNNVDAALAIQAEREHVMQDPAVTAAEFDLAMAGGVESSTPPEPTENEADDERPGDNGKEGGATEAAPPDALPAVVPGGPVPSVYAPGQKAPTADATAFKRLILSRTDHSPLSTPVAVNALSLAKSETVRQEGFVRREEILDHWQLRLQVRTSPAAGTLGKPTVYVQFYIKNAEAQGRVAPELLTVQHVALDRLAPEITTIDFPPIDVLMVRERVGPGGVWRSQGKEFYGVIVSVFDADMALVSQGVSIRGLNGEASPSLPGKSPREQMEDARVLMESARANLNGVRMVFFANQHDEENRKRFQQAQAEFEKAQKSYLTLKAQSATEGVHAK